MHLAIVEPVGKRIFSTSFAVMIGCCFFPHCVFERKENQFCCEIIFESLEKKKHKILHKLRSSSAEIFQNEFFFNSFFK